MRRTPTLKELAQTLYGALTDDKPRTEQERLQSAESLLKQVYRMGFKTGQAAPGPSVLRHDD